MCMRPGRTILKNKMPHAAGVLDYYCTLRITVRRTVRDGAIEFEIELPDAVGLVLYRYL